MASKLGTYWQKIQQHPVIAILVLIGSALGIALIVVVILGYWLNWHWTGLVPEASEPKQHLKTLWDWLQLLVIPLMLAVGGFWLNQLQKGRDERAIAQRAKTEREAAEQRDKTEREIAADNQREAALQAYLDKMSELLLEKQLRNSAEGDEIQKIARIRTLTALRGLDPTRKASVIQFLQEAGLIGKDKYIINLGEADLGEADLGGANLSRAYLSRAYLSRAYLSRANLREADLSGANLSRANLDGAYLSEANLRRANLRRANLRRAYLSRAYLRGADLREADLNGADLREADLNGANLREPIGVTIQELEKQNASLKGATMPDGSKHS